MRARKRGVLRDESRKKGRVKPALSLSPSFLTGLKALRRDPVVKTVYSIAASKRRKAPLYIVGGVLRNLALGKPLPPDYDFVYGGPVKGISDETAARLKGSSFVLDKETLSYRVAVKGRGRGGGGKGKGKAAPFSVDFSPVKDNDIKKDLLSRDFTVNSIALDVRTVFEDDSPSVLDPAGGMGDCSKLVLRATSGKAFDEDPLRVIRAVRISRQYGLRIPASTEALLKKKARLLKRTAAERIRDELVLIFSSPFASSSVKALYGYGCVDSTLPELSAWPDIGGYGLLAHSLKTLDEAERLSASVCDDLGPIGRGGRGGRGVPDFKERLKHYLLSSSGPVNNRALFKLSAFLHDIGKPMTMGRVAGQLRFIGHDYEGSLLCKEMLKRLRFSRHASNLMTNLVKNHHRVFAMARLGQRTARAKAHLFRTVGDNASLMLLCLSLADARATRGGEDPHLFKVVNELLDFYFNVYTRKKPRPLLNGHEIMRTFNIPEGPLVGEVIGMMGRAVEAGVIKDREGAVNYIREWLKGKGGGVGGRKRSSQNK